MKLPALNPQAFSQLLGVASDVALVLDLQGTVEDVSVARDSLGSLGCQSWFGRPWLDTVTSESRAKIQDMLLSQGASESMRWRHVNHPTPMGNDVAVQYVLLPLGEGKLLAVGRDLESLAELQRRLVETPSMNGLHKALAAHTSDSQLVRKAIWVLDTSRVLYNATLTLLATT